MWQLSRTSEVEKRTKRHQKKHSRELTNVFDNLDTFFECLQAGAAPATIHRGFIHPEPAGVLAIDQKGKGAHLKEFRLYVYPDEQTEILHLITLGDKSSQSDDIQYSKKFVEELRQETDTVEETEDPEETEQ